jgi:hypothetical protein
MHFCHDTLRERPRGANRDRGMASPRIDKNIAARIGRHAGYFAEVHVLRQAQEIGHRVVTNHRHGLGKDRRAKQSQC